MRLVGSLVVVLGASFVAIGCAEGVMTDYAAGGTTGPGASGTGASGTGASGAGASGAGTTGSGASGTGASGSGASGAGGGEGGCAAEPAETSGASCTDAIELGTLTDAKAELVKVTGNAPKAGRTVWWAFDAVDDLDTAGDEFHVDVRFLKNPSDGYKMHVRRNGCDAGDEIATGETEAFDWFTDFPATSNNCTTTAPCGEGDCVATADPAKNTCEDNSATFYLGVTRTKGDASCDGFELELSNGKY